MTLLTYATYGSSAFEIFAGVTFILNPAGLLNGYTPSNGYETLAFEWFGSVIIFYGLLLACLKDDKRMNAFATLYNLVWALSLGSTYLGKPWRPESAVRDGSWAYVFII